jgi:hypothetical protein
LNTNRFILEWSVIDEGSGYQRAEITIDGELIGSVESPDTSLSIVDLSWGIHIVNLKVFDWANRNDSIEFQIVLQQPILNFLPQMMILGGVGIVLILIIYYKKR